MRPRCVSGAPRAPGRPCPGALGDWGPVVWLTICRSAGAPRALGPIWSRPGGGPKWSTRSLGCPGSAARNGGLHRSGVGRGGVPPR